MSNKNEVFEYLIDQLRQQVNNNQCEDLAHEVLSLKNQLRDASAQIKELQEDNIKKSEHISHLTGQVKELHLALAQATGNVEAYKLARKGGYISECQSYVVGEHGPEQSGCRKEDVQECDHNWRFVNGKAPAVCINCGVTKSSECEHEWRTETLYGARVVPTYCRKCGVYRQKDEKNDTQGCEHEWRFYGAGFSCKCIKCGAIA